MEEAKSFRNGHHTEQGRGDTVYRGPLEFLPPPMPIESPEAAAELMYSDGCVQSAMNSSNRRRYLIQVHYGIAKYRTSGPPITQLGFWAKDVLDRITPRQRILAGDVPHGKYG